MFRFDIESEREFNENIMCVEVEEGNLSTADGTTELGPTMIEGVNIVRNSSFASILPSESGRNSNFST